MNIVSLFPAYIVWHYGHGLQEAISIWGNYLWFFYRLFSIPTLFRTLFSPWRRLGERYKRGTPVELFFEAVLVNTLMRLTGALIRLIFICVGTLLLALTCVLGSLCLVVWVLLPAIVIFLLLAGVGSFLQGV